MARGGRKDTTVNNGGVGGVRGAGGGGGHCGLGTGWGLWPAPGGAAAGETRPVTGAGGGAVVGIWGVGGYGGSGGALPRAVPRGDGWHQHPGGGWTDRSPLTSSPTGRDAAPAAPGRGSGRRRDRVRVRVRDARAASGSRPWTAPSWRVTARGQRAKVTGGGKRVRAES